MNTIEPPNKIPNGTVLVGFFISPLTLSDVSKPANAKNNRSAVLLKVFNDGNSFQYRLLASTLLKPNRIIANNGNNLMIVIHLIKLTPCLTPRILTNTMNPMMIKKKQARASELLKMGNKVAIESAIIFINAALPKTLQPKKYNQLMI